MALHETDALQGTATEARRDDATLTERLRRAGLRDEVLANASTTELLERVLDRLDQERAAHADAEAHARVSREAMVRLQILAEASRAFSATGLELQPTFEAVVEFVAELLGDGCALSIASEDGADIEAVAVHHPEPAPRELLRALFTRPWRAGEGLPGRVYLTGEPLFLPVFDPSSAPESARNETFAYFEQCKPHSIIIVPLRLREQTLGTLAISRDRSGPSYTAADVQLLQDLADRAALVIDNARLYSAAREAVRVRDEFLSVAGHELKTPLTALQLQLEGLSRLADRGDETMSPRARLRLVTAVRQLGRLAILVHQLLDVARITGGRLTVTPDELDLVALTREAAERFTEEQMRTGSTVIVHADEGAVVGHWDPIRMEQVVTNLLSNAIKYGGGRPVTVRVARVDDVAKLEVRDEGHGIAAVDQARIFGRFERAVDSRHFGGVGLGLWIVRQVVEAHGGTVGLVSEPGRGSTFSVTLPLATRG